MKDFANSEQSSNSDRPSGFNLLPVPRREAERNHVFLAVASFSSQFFNPMSENLEEFLLIRHPTGTTL
jgi:hypothetical protein